MAFLVVKELWKSVKLWQSYRHWCRRSAFLHTV